MQIQGNQITLGSESFEADLEKLEEGVYVLRMGDRKVEVFAKENEDGSFEVTIDSRSETIRVKDEAEILLDSYRSKSSSESGVIQVKAPMPGLVYKALVKAGDLVEKGQGVLILEAMKMENEIRASHPATVEEVFVVEGQAVSKGEKMLVLKIGE